MEQTMNMVLTAVILAQTILLGTLAWLFRAKVHQINATIRTFITPKGPDEASPLALTVDIGADMVARAVMARAKTTFLGQQSGAVRQEKAVEGAIAEDMARAAHPMVGPLLDQMPELRKTLRRNPALLDFALSKLATKAAANQPQTTATPQSNNGKGGGING